MITVPDALVAELCAHARESYPAECCGYLRGPRDADVVDEIVRCRNAQPDGEHPTHPERGADTGFVIAGRELFDFARSFGSDRPARVVYHSHPNGRAYLSAVDRTNALTPAGPAYPVEHLVVGVTAGGVTELARYTWSEAAGDFVEVARVSPRC
jgi:proteasome lid subunit RPN8/RPN11